MSKSKKIGHVFVAGGHWVRTGQQEKDPNSEAFNDH